MSGLPSNWAVAPISDVTVECPQRVPAADELFVYIDISAVDRANKRITAPQELVGAEAPSRARKQVQAGDVLVSMTRPNLNAVAMVPRELDGQIASTGFEVLRAPGLDPRWLFYIVRTDAFVANMSDLVQGALYPAIRAKDVRAYQAVIAPRNEQTRIADKLDALLTRVDACRDSLDRVPGILKRFRQAVLAAATSGELTAEWRKYPSIGATGGELLEKLRLEHHERRQMIRAAARSRSSTILEPVKESHSKDGPESVDGVSTLPELPDSWAWATGAELVEPGADIVYGIVQPGPKLPDGVPYVRGMDIEEGRILVHRLMKTSRKIADRYARSSLVGGDVLLGIIRATKVAIVPDELAGGNITQGTARFRPSSAISSEYLALALEAPATQSWLHSHYRGIDMPGLNLADVRRVPIPLPPRAEQHEIVRRVGALLDLANRLEACRESAGKHIEHLTPALLAKAFRGELVLQDPDDEPAVLLLDRIRAAREVSRVHAKQRRRRAAMKSKTRTVSITGGSAGIVHALREARRELSGTALFAAAGYPPDADPESVEEFFVAVRDALRDEQITRERRGDTDWFSLVRQ